MKKKTELFVIISIFVFAVCACNIKVESKNQENISESVSCKELLKNWFDEGYQPDLKNIVSLNEFKEIDNYKITLCEMLSNNTATYILIKIETKDGSKLKTGDTDKAPSVFRGPLTDIDIEYSMFKNYKHKSFASGDVFCEKIKEESDFAAYYIIEGFYRDDTDIVSDENSNICLTITQIKLYEPYKGSLAEKESVLAKKDVMFEINNSTDNKFYLFETDNGEKGYLTNNAFITKFEYDIDNPPNIRWEIEYNGDVINGNFDDAYRLVNGKIINLKWIRKYIDVDKVSKIIINGKLYSRTE